MGRAVVVVATGGTSTNSFVHCCYALSSKLQVCVATPKGAPYVCIGGGVKETRWLQDFMATPKSTPIAFEDVDVGDVACVVVPAAGTTCFNELAISPELAALMIEVFNQKTPLCMIGLGLAAVVSTGTDTDRGSGNHGQDRASVVNGYAVTGASNEEMFCCGALSLCTTSIEDTLKMMGARFSVSDAPDAVHVVLDRSVVTAQNAQSSTRAVQMLLYLVAH